MIDLRKHTYPGRLLVFEGTDGAGKTTIIGKTCEYLTERLGPEGFILQKQPTDLSRKTKLFQKMMYCANHEEINYRAVQLLTLSDRVQHDFEVIRPALQAGKIVLCDRYLYTSVANMRARGYCREKWFFQACREIVRPDAVFLAHVDPALAVKRIKSRPNECGRHLNEELLHRVSAEFLNMCRTEKFCRIDTSGSADTAFEMVKAKLSSLLDGGKRARLSSLPDRGKRSGLSSLLDGGKEERR